MKCVICKSSDIKIKVVEEEVKLEKDIVLIPIEVLVCHNCGERYYDRKTMQKLDEIKSKLKGQALEVEDVGKVLRAKVG
jgi:YgiT-type zinc finger domain-containing protein